MRRETAKNILLASGQFTQAREYWFEKLAGQLKGVSFPYDHRQTKKANHQQKFLKFPQKLSQQLIRLSNRSFKRLYMILHTILKILLLRYTKETDLIIVSPIDYQVDAGDYLNTLLLFRDQVSAKMNFKEALFAVQKSVEDGWYYQNYPYELILKELDYLPSQLCKIGLVVDNFQEKAFLDELDLEMCFYFSQTDQLLSGSVEYNPDLFQHATIEQIIKHFLSLAETCLESPEEILDDLNFLSITEQDQLTLNLTKRPYPLNKLIHQLFQEQVDKTPEHPCLIFRDAALTYAELNRQANQLARVLVKKGVLAEKIVGLILEPSLEMIIALLAILKAGGAFLPIDPQYPSERIRFMLEDSELDLLLTTKNLKDLIAASYTGQQLILDDQELWAKESEENLQIVLSPDNLAYVIYTSGSTGQPKGVLIEHHSVVNLSYWHGELLKINSLDRLAKYSSMSFDASILEIFPYLAFGAAIVIVPPEIRKDLDKLADWYQKAGITVAMLPTGMCMLMVAEYPDLNLRCLLTGGEKLKPTPVTNYLIVDNYGPSENTVVTTVYLRPPGYPHQSLIGKPIANTQVFILDDNLRLVPSGVKGELYVTGEGLARGYLKQKELTAATFLPNPFAQGTRIYRTGDLARWRSDGNLEFLGRIDRQVQIRGHRVELGEIEMVLRQLPAIESVALNTLEDSDGQQQLIGYLVAKEKLDIKQIRSYLQSKLPIYMLPTAFVILDQLPLNPNGKVNYQALPDWEAVHSDTDYLAPKTELERRLVAIWEEVLSQSPIGVNDNFFALGGHSLKATRVLTNIFKETGRQISVERFFSGPTIAQLVKNMELQNEKTLEEIHPQPKREYYPLTHGQRRLWIFDQLSSQSVAYTMPAVLLLEGSLNISVLERACQTIIERHEILRTRFFEREGQPVQSVDVNFNFQLDYQTNLETKVDEYIQDRLATPFDLQQAGQIRVNLVQLTEDQHLLIVNLHHIIADGWSIDLLISELTMVYNAYLQGKPNPLIPLPIQYHDYALWQNQRLQSEFSKEEEYWLKKLRGELSELKLPNDPINDNQFVGARRIEWQLSPELLTQLRQKYQNHGTINMIIVAGLNVLLSKLTGEDDILIGTSMAGRTHSNLEKLIGFFVNTIVLRTDLTGDPSFQTILARVRETILSALQHQDYPYDRLKDRLVIQNGRELFNIMVNYFVRDDMKKIYMDGLEMKKVSFDLPEPKFDLDLYIDQFSEQLSITVVYKASLFTEKTIISWLSYLTNILTSISKNSERKLSEINLLSAAEYDTLLANFNQDLS